MAAALSIPLPGSAVHAFAVTASNTTVYTTATRYVYVGGAGNLAVLMAGDSVSVILTAVPVGTLLPISVTQILATGTTATNLIGMF